MKIVFLDTEFTSWQGCNQKGWDAAKGQHREIVQIGAVRVCTRRKRITASFERFVLPIKNPVLSDYLEKLTGVTTDKLVADGVGFHQACRDLRAFIGKSPIVARGNEDVIFAENRKLNGIELIEPSLQVIDISPWLVANIGGKGLTSGNSAGKLGLAVPHPGREHDALYDSCSLAIASLHLLARGHKPPEGIIVRPSWRRSLDCRL